MLNPFQEQPATIIKVGGSLFDSPDLGSRLESFLQTHQFPNPVLISVGAVFADVIRRLDRIHQLEDSVSHLLGTNTLNLSSRFVASLSDKLVQTSCPVQVSTLREQEHVPVFDASEFTLEHSLLPSSWDVTSDSIAAWLCSLHPESQLVLLKSRRAPLPLTFFDAAQNGLVDLHFPNVASDLDTIYWCNFRDDSPTIHQWK